MEKGEFPLLLRGGTGMGCALIFVLLYKMHVELLGKLRVNRKKIDLIPCLRIF